MTAATTFAPTPRVSPYAGLRMTADDFFKIPDNESWYELIDGVVLVSPSPTPVHQVVAGEVFRQLANFLSDHPIGLVSHETDVQFGSILRGRDVVYRPEIVYYACRDPLDIPDRLVGAPDVVVEVISPFSRLIDCHTKRDDYERFGVREYWLVDPERDAFLFFRRKGRRFTKVRVTGKSFASKAIPGFILELDRVRRIWKRR